MAQPEAMNRTRSAATGRIVRREVFRGAGVGIFKKMVLKMILLSILLQNEAL